MYIRQRRQLPLNLCKFNCPTRVDPDNEVTISNSTLHDEIEHNIQSHENIDGLPIAISKGTRGLHKTTFISSCTFLTFTNFSPSQYTFLCNLKINTVSNTLSEDLTNKNWKHMNVKIKAWDKTKTWEWWSCQQGKKLRGCNANGFTQFCTGRMDRTI